MTVVNDNDMYSKPHLLMVKIQQNILQLVNKPFLSQATAAGAQERAEGEATSGLYPRKYSCDRTWKEGTLVGVHYDSWRGEIEFYLNRTPLGKAFTGIPSATDIYPMFCSTSAKTKMRLVCAQKYPAGLAFDCARALCRYGH